MNCNPNTIELIQMSFHHYKRLSLSSVWIASKYQFTIYTLDTRHSILCMCVCGYFRCKYIQEFHFRSFHSIRCVHLTITKANVVLYQACTCVYFIHAVCVHQFYAMATLRYRNSTGKYVSLFTITSKSIIHIQMVQVHARANCCCCCRYTTPIANVIRIVFASYTHDLHIVVHEILRHTIARFSFVQIFCWSRHVEIATICAVQALQLQTAVNKGCLLVYRFVFSFIFSLFLLAQSCGFFFIAYTWYRGLNIQLRFSKKRNKKKNERTLG